MLVPCVSLSDPENGNVTCPSKALTQMSSRTHVPITVIMAISQRVTDKQNVELMGHGVVSQ